MSQNLTKSNQNLKNQQASDEYDDCLDILDKMLQKIKEKYPRNVKIEPEVTSLIVLSPKRRNQRFKKLKVKKEELIDLKSENQQLNYENLNNEANIDKNFDVEEAKTDEEESNNNENFRSTQQNIKEFDIRLRDIRNKIQTGWFGIVKVERNELFTKVLNKTMQKFKNDTVKSSKIDQHPSKSQKTTVKCKICKIVILKCNLVPHMKKYHPETFKELFKCQICNNKYIKKISLDKHIELKHINVKKIKKYECDLCGKIMTSKGSIKQHLRFHLPKVKCSICEAEINVQSMRSHLMSIHGSKERKYSCEICSRTFKSTIILKHHQKTHDKKFECQICKNKFPTRFYLKKHQQEIHENPGSYSCDMCDKKFNRKYHVEEHVKIHMENRPKPFKCHRCDYASDCRSKLNKHLNFHRRHDEKQKIKLNAKPKILECDFCGLKFVKKSMHTHIKVHLSTIKCKICNAELKQLSLAAHMKCIHGSKDAEFKCEICSKVFNSMLYLRTHQLIHDKRFECQICNKKFTHQCTLNKHQEDFHKNSLSYSCAICERKFNAKKNLINHHKVHFQNRPKPFKCQRCDYATDVRSTFKNHMIYHRRKDEKFAAMRNQLKCPKMSRFKK